ncbi:acetylcholine receptor subunit beta-like 2 [Procambarus clarkii]|uniref:acetylcholine receptor subunit beta-like 2 n=1 Tax=Procambarus clarkii TaxID=6728 RepID=UPI00374403B0
MWVTKITSVADNCATRTLGPSSPYWFMTHLHHHLSIMKVLILALLAGYLSPARGTGSRAPDQDNFDKDNWISRLYKDKLKGYNKESRPVLDHTHNTTVYLGLSLNYIHLDDVRQELSVNAWSIMTWVDEYLRWEPKNYINLDRIHFDDDDIWMPDISVYNSAEGSDVHPFGRVPVLANSVGQTYWFPPTHLVVKCDLDLTNWPSDEHSCLVRMGSWTHHGEQIDIQIMSNNGTNGVIMTNFEKNNQWKLINVTATRSLISLEEHDPYVEVDFTFNVKRQASMHATFITQSTLALVMVVLMSYALPLDSFFSRLIIHLFALGVLITCYFSLFAFLPANGGPVPLVVRYYSGTIILTTISLLCTFFLTAQGNCCTSTPTNTLSRKLASAVTFVPGLRDVVPQQTYNHLEAEMIEEGDGSSTQPTTAQDSSGISLSQIKRVVNFLLLVLFTIAYIVDYAVLRSVAV